MQPTQSGPRFAADEHDGTCSFILDLSQPYADHPHVPGWVAVAHSDAPANVRPRSGRLAIEFLADLPADLHCPDRSPSETTAFLGAPQCVAGALAVRHQPACPRLADLINRFGVRL